MESDSTNTKQPVDPNIYTLMTFRTQGKSFPHLMFYILKKEKNKSLPCLNTVKIFEFLVMSTFRIDIALEFEEELSSKVLG